MGPNQSDSELSQNKPFSFVSQIFSGISLRQPKVTKGSVKDGSPLKGCLLSLFLGVGWSYHPCLLGPWYLVSLEVIWGAPVSPGSNCSQQGQPLSLDLLIKGRSHGSLFPPRSTALLASVLYLLCVGGVGTEKGLLCHGLAWNAWDHTFLHCFLLPHPLKTPSPRI